MIDCFARFTLLILIGTLSSCQEKMAPELKEPNPSATVQKPEPFVPSYVIEEAPVAADVEKENQYYLKKEKSEIVAEEKFKADPLNVPLDLTDSKWKDHQGLYYELDLGGGWVGFDFLNEDHLSVGFSPNLKCHGSKRKPWPDCLSVFEPLLHERVSVEGKKIFSLVVPVTDFDRVPVMLINGKALRMTTDNLPTRYHLIKKGELKSQVFSREYSKLKLTALVYAGYPDAPPVVLNELVSLKKMLPADFKNKDDYFLMKGKYLKIVNYYNPKESVIEFYPSMDLSGEPVELKAVPVVIDDSNSNGNDLKSFLKFKAYDDERNLIIVSDGSRDFYGSLGLCRKLECTFVYYPQSRYENDLLEIELIQKKKIKSEIQSLVDKMQGCIAKKDEKCIDSLFLKQAETPGDEDSPCIDMTVKLPSYSFTMDDFEELKACMKIESLMFHKLAFKGNKKFCSLADFHPTIGAPFKLLAIGPQEIIKADYRNYIYGEYYRVPPKLRHEVEEMLYLRDK